MGDLAYDTVLTITTYPTIADTTITGDSAVHSTPPTMQEGLKDASVISSTPPTMEEGLKDASVISSTPPTKEEGLKDDSLVPLIRPVIEGFIAKTPNLNNGDSVLDPKEICHLFSLLGRKPTRPKIPSNSGTITIFNNTNKNISFLKKLNQVNVLKHGVIVEVHESVQAQLAREAGAKAVVLSKPPECSSLGMLEFAAVKMLFRIPVIGKVRVGHFGEAQILQSYQIVNFIDENAFTGTVDAQNYINKHAFELPFVCGCQDIGEVLNRVNEGAALIRIQGNPKGIEDTIMKVKQVMNMLRELKFLEEDWEVLDFARKVSAPYDLVANIKDLDKFPVPIFAAGGIYSAADATLMMELGCDGVFVGSYVFEADTDSGDSSKLLEKIVQAVAHFNDP